MYFLILLLPMIKCQLYITLPDIANSSSIYSARNIINYTDVSGHCFCDNIYGLCDKYCCCDSICSNADKLKWGQEYTCLNSSITNYKKYPLCGSLVKNRIYSEEFYVNQVNDILCVVFERLPYAGVYKNLDDQTNANENKLTFDKDIRTYLYRILNDSQPGITIDTPKYSGFPGYRIGYPLMLASGSNPVKQWLKPLSLQAWKSDLNCALNSETAIDDKIVNFGEDISIQCSLPASSYTTYCNGDTSGFKIFNNMVDSVLMYVGQWGSSNYSREGEWTQIAIQELNYTKDSYYCSGIFMKQLNIFYQKTGFVGDLQNHIVRAYQSDIPNTIFRADLTNFQLTLTYKINFKEMNNYEIDPTLTKSTRDTIAPYITRIFRPFNKGYLLGILILVMYFI